MLPVIDTYLSDTLILPEPPKKYKKPSKKSAPVHAFNKSQICIPSQKNSPEGEFFLYHSGPDQASPTEILPAISSAVMVDSASMSAMW